MTERGHAYAARSAMTKTPRTPPTSTAAPRPPAEALGSEVAAQPSGEAVEVSNPFASLASPQPGDAGGETKLFEVPRELIEIARARATDPTSSCAGTLTPIAPRPNAELEATLAAYTAGLTSTSGQTPSSKPARREPGPRGEVETETMRSGRPAAGDAGSGTGTRRNAAPGRALETPRPRTAKQSAERGPGSSGRKPLLRGPIAPRSAPARPRSQPVSARPAHGRPWLFYAGLCLILGYLLLRALEQ